MVKSEKSESFFVDHDNFRSDKIFISGKKDENICWIVFYFNQCYNSKRSDCTLKWGKDYHKFHRTRKDLENTKVLALFCTRDKKWLPQFSTLFAFSHHPLPDRPSQLFCRSLITYKKWLLKINYNRWHFCKLPRFNSSWVSMLKQEKLAILICIRVKSLVH